MKRIVSAALVATLMAGSALAQPPERGNRGDGPRPERGDGGGRPDQGQQQPRAEQPQVQQGAPQPGRGSYLRSPEDRRQEYRGGDPRQQDRAERRIERRDDRQDNRADRRDDRQDNRADRRDNRQDNRADRRDNRQDWRNDSRGWQNDSRNWQNDNRSWQNDYRRPGQQWDGPRGGYQYRDRDRGRPQFDQRRYRPSYRAPQRFRIAPYRAPPGFYARSWNFGDRLPFGWYSAPYYLNWVAYGLPMPPIGAEWVRVGSDALLVDVWNGQVLSVFYGLFW
jgi:hypothetical protein